MSLTAGIVGLPNVGKSTIFNALTEAGAQSENYPFCTIDPNVGVVPVPDERLDILEEHIETEEVVPASVEILDIAGLVRGASEGEGLGNQFLANIREVDAILHVVRCFEDDDIPHVEGDVDPVRDVEIIDTELMMADLDTITDRLEDARRAARSHDKEDLERVEVLEEIETVLSDGQPARTADVSDRQWEDYVRECHLLTAKPVLYVANVDEDDLDGDSRHVEALRDLAASRDSRVVVLCGSIESEIAEMEDDEEREAMVEMLGIDEPALNLLIRRAYDLLGLHTFFTVAGDRQIRGWTLPVGATAPEAAGKVHSDFQDNFIKAEVYTVEELEKYGDEASIREAGDLRIEGKDYVVEDGDVMRILHDA